MTVIILVVTIHVRAAAVMMMMTAANLTIHFGVLNGLHQTSIFNMFHGGTGIIIRFPYRTTFPFTAIHESIRRRRRCGGGGGGSTFARVGAIATDDRRGSKTASGDRCRGSQCCC